MSGLKPPFVSYYFSNHLGTHSLITDANGTMPPHSESDYYPYGGEIPITTGDPNHYKFTGKERDAGKAVIGILLPAHETIYEVNSHSKAH